MNDLIELLLQPLPVGLSLMLFGLARAKAANRRCPMYVLAGIACISIASMPLVGRGLMASLENNYPSLYMDSIPENSSVLVFSGGIDMPVEPRKYFELTHASDRLLYTYNLYNTGKVGTIVMTGGTTYPDAPIQSEASYGVQLLQGWGVNPKVLVSENSSTNTYENVKNSVTLLSALEQKTLLVVTSAAHMPRVMAVMEKQVAAEELVIIAAPTDFRVALSKRNYFYSLVPSSPGLNLTTLAIHEYLGWFYYKLKGYI